ncbi:hypothetical protein [Streptococcus sp. k-432]|uniref:hypothetical protein n=1 Tax=Streptococcus sp. k-432 TaxID=2582634 RepID=UPI0015679BE6|nr:hypothetical protein [Streptococcus sp. k-432]
MREPSGSLILFSENFLHFSMKCGKIILNENCFEVVDRTDEVSSKHCFEVVDRTDEVSSKHCFEVVDKTDEVSSKHCFEVVDKTDEVSNIYLRQGEVDVV